MKRIIALFSLVFGLAAIWTGVWFFIAGQIGTQVALLATPSNANQPTFTCGQFSTTGFPFRFDVTCAEATVTQSDVTIELAELKATVLVYRPTHIIAFAQSPVTYSDAFFGTHQQLSWTKFEASLRMNGWQLARFSAVADDIVFSDLVFGETLIAQSPHIEAHILGTAPEAETTDDSINVGLFARATEADMPGFAINQAALTFEADVTQMPNDIRQWQRLDLIRRWQADNGAVKIHRIDITQPDASINVSGDLQLNENGEATGELALASTNIAPRLDLFLAPEIRDIFIGKQQDDGSNKQIFTIRRGAIFAGLIPVGTTPALF